MASAKTQPEAPAAVDWNRTRPVWSTGTVNAAPVPLRNLLPLLLRNAPTNLRAIVAARSDCQLGLDDLVDYGQAVMIGAPLLVPDVTPLLIVQAPVMVLCAFSALRPLWRAPSAAQGARVMRTALMGLGVTWSVLTGDHSTLSQRAALGAASVAGTAVLWALLFVRREPAPSDDGGGR